MDAPTSPKSIFNRMGLCQEFPAKGGKEEGEAAKEEGQEERRRPTCKGPGNKAAEEEPRSLGGVHLRRGFQACRQPRSQAAGERCRCAANFFGSLLCTAIGREPLSLLCLQGCVSLRDVHHSLLQHEQFDAVWKSIVYTPLMQYGMFGYK